MHPAAFVACLAGLAVAAPVGKSIAEPAKGETIQPVVQDYASYGEYYIKYGDYPSVAEARSASMALSKRGYSCYTSYTPYPSALDAEAPESSMAEKRGYGTYAPYCVYGAAAEAEAAKMKDANMSKRHMAMSVPEGTAVDADTMEQQDMAVSVGDAAIEHDAAKVTYQTYR
ncbi:hypothetical protein BM1_07518 [Bipolaris maydis]|nr:hypothetical protein BM1_07518 [Bipolaris maydis]